MDLWVIFITGLTTGGLTCLAVQGGLLATALTKQTEVIVKGKRKRRTKVHKTGIQLPKNPWLVVYFLAAKLLAYTVLGFLLGLLGSVMQLPPTVQAIMQILVGLFMIANALNMFNVHPIFRYFVIQPPKALTRLVRNQAKSQEAFTPVLLGLLTIFIPCGTTQAMEVLAISTGSPLLGALIMFVFILGTSPTFFVLGFLATQIRGKFQQPFVLATAVLVIFLGVVSINGGLNILGSPLAPSRIIAALQSNSQSESSSAKPIAANVTQGVQEVTINANSAGYSPNFIRIKRGQPTRLHLVTNNTYSCARSFMIPALGIRKVLPVTGDTTIDIGAFDSGSLYFTCSMGMYTGTIMIS